MAVAALPPRIQALGNTTPEISPPYTSVSHGMIAGLQGTMIWDSAATLNFISDDHVRWRKLHIIRHEHDLRLNLVHLGIQKFSKEKGFKISRSDKSLKADYRKSTYRYRGLRE
jgi:hypothetical protein